MLISYLGASYYISIVGKKIIPFSHRLAFYCNMVGELRFAVYVFIQRYLKYNKSKNNILSINNKKNMHPKPHALLSHMRKQII